MLDDTGWAFPHFHLALPSCPVLFCPVLSSPRSHLPSSSAHPISFFLFDSSRDNPEGSEITSNTLSLSLPSVVARSSSLTPDNLAMYVLYWQHLLVSFEHPSVYQPTSNTLNVPRYTAPVVPFTAMGMNGCFSFPLPTRERESCYRWKGRRGPDEPTLTLFTPNN
jgi:hypothetical protein